MIIVIVLAGFIFIGSAYSADIDVQSVDDNLTQTNQENINEFTEDSSILTYDISRNGASSAISDEKDKVNDLKAGEITVNNEDELQKAVDNESISYIKIGRTIDLTKQIVILRDSVTIKGLDWDFPYLHTSLYRSNKFTQPDEGGAILWKGANGKLINCVFDGFSATNYGGAIYSDYGLNLTHYAFVNCVAGQGGGAISLYKGSTVLNDCFFLRCNVSYFGYDVHENDGGAIHVTLGNLEVYNSQFENCSANGSGGAINMRSGSIVGCTFVLCSADVSGAITADNALIRNCTFDENSATDGGALGFVCDSQNAVIDCIFKKNYARTTDHSIGTGGAISPASSYCNITNCSFMNNSADMGDSIYLYPLNRSSPQFIFISNCTFDENKNEDIIYIWNLVIQYILIIMI